MRSGSMNLINQEVTHTAFGKGNIVSHNGSIVTIDFNDETKKFFYPDAFKKFITMNDRETAESLEKVLLKKEKEDKALEKERKIEREQQLAEQKRREFLENNKIHESSQVVFWLDQEEAQNVFHDWQVSTGKVQSGKSKGEPNRIARLSPNSVSLLTTREVDQPETERQIIGLYMVPETLTGDKVDNGMVPAHEEYRVELTEQEAEKLLFWDYYINKNYPHRTTWNSGKYRYYDNEWTAQILQDIIALKTDEEERKEVENFLDYFCQMNALDIDNIPASDGALKQ